MTNLDTFPTISLDALHAVSGGIERGTSQTIGRNVAETGVLAGGAALGTYLGGPVGAAAGTALAEGLNRTGLPGAAGSWAGGKVHDGVAAAGRGIQNAWNWATGR